MLLEQQVREVQKKLTPAVMSRLSGKDRDEVSRLLVSLESSVRRDKVANSFIRFAESVWPAFIGRWLKPLKGLPMGS